MGTSGGYIDVKSLPATGTYTILVDPQLAVIGSATLQLYDVPADLTSSITAGGAPLTVTTTIPGQNAKLTFAGTAGRRISLTVSGVTIGTSTTGSLKVSITKPDGTALVTATSMGTNGGFIDVKSLPTTGTYTILVDPQSFAIGSATLQLYDVPADASAAITAGGAPVTVTTTIPGQNAKLTFAGTAGRGIALSLSGVTIGPSTTSSLKLSITKPDGTSFFAPALYGTNGTFVDTLTLPVTGAYSILIDPAAASIGSATVRLYDVDPEASASITPGGTPVSVSLGLYQNGRVTFAGIAGERVSMNIGFVPTACCTVNVSILNPNGTRLVNPIAVASGQVLMDAKTLPTTGTYTIVVDPYQTAAGTVTLTLFDLPPDVSATATLGGPAVTLTTVAAGQNARALFTGTAGDGVIVRTGPARHPLAAREEKARVEEDDRRGDEDRRRRSPEPRDGAARGRDCDTRQDEAVADGPAANRREGDHDHGQRAQRVPEDGDEPGGPEVQVLLRLRDRAARDRRRQRDREGDPDREPGVEEAERCGPAPSGEEQRADAEERRREEAPAEVVDAEGAVVPAGRGAPGEGSRRGRVGEERGRPRGELRRSARPPAAQQVARESEREERSRECKQCLHTVS